MPFWNHSAKSLHAGKARHCIVPCGGCAEPRTTAGAPSRQTRTKITFKIRLASVAPVESNKATPFSPVLD